MEGGNPGGGHRRTLQKDDLPTNASGVCLIRQRMGLAESLLNSSDDAWQIVEVFGLRRERVEAAMRDEVRCALLPVLRRLLDRVGTDTNALRVGQPARTRRPVFPSRPAVAPEVDPVQPATDHLEIEMLPVDARMIERQVRRGIATDQGKRLVGTPADCRQAAVFHDQLEWSASTTGSQKIVHGNHRVTVPQQARRPPLRWLDEPRVSDLHDDQSILRRPQRPSKRSLGPLSRRASRPKDHYSLPESPVGCRCSNTCKRSWLVEQPSSMAFRDSGRTRLLPRRRAIGHGGPHAPREGTWTAGPTSSREAPPVRRRRSPREAATSRGSV